MYPPCTHPPLPVYNDSMNNDTNDNCKRHTKNDGSYWVNDARGIPLARVCDLCYAKKLSKFRKDVRTNANYWADEIIDSD